MIIGLPKSTRAEHMGFVVNKVALEQIIFQPMVVVYLPSGAQFFPTAVVGNVLTRAVADLVS
jgi:hypothetical protein